MNTEHIDKMIDKMCDEVCSYESADDRAYLLQSIAEVIKARAEIAKLDMSGDALNSLTDLMKTI